MTGFEAAQAAYDSELPPYLEDEDDEPVDEEYIEEMRLMSRDYDAWANL